MDKDLIILKQRFADLIGRHSMLVRKICWKYSDKDVEKCGELVQECYLALWHRLPSLNADVSRWRERSWVLWSCRSTLSHRLRRRRRWWMPLDDVPDDSFVIDPDNTLREHLEALAENLTDRERLYLQLYLDGYSHHEIAQHLDIKTDSVYKMRQRIIEKMKRNAKEQ